MKYNTTIPAHIPQGNILDFSGVDLKIHSVYDKYHIGTLRGFKIYIDTTNDEVVVTSNKDGNETPVCVLNRCEGRSCESASDEFNKLVKYFYKLISMGIDEGCVLNMEIDVPMYYWSRVSMDGPFERNMSYSPVLDKYRFTALTNKGITMLSLDLSDNVGYAIA